MSTAKNPSAPPQLASGIAVPSAIPAPPTIPAQPMPDNRMPLPGTPQPPGTPQLENPVIAQGSDELVELMIKLNPLADARPFPTDVLPTAFSDYIHASANSIGSDQAMIALPILSALSGVIGNSYWVEVLSSWRMPCMIWTIVIAPSGSAKSSSLDCAVQPIRQLAARFDGECEAAMKEYPTQLARHAERKKLMKDGGEDPGPEPEEPVRRRIDFHDVTVEALVSVLSRNPRGGILIADEIQVWLSGFNLYKAKGRGTDLAKWSEIWNGNTLRIDRKTGVEREIHVPKPFMAVTGGIQTELFKSRVDREALDSGMLSRILPSISTDVKQPGNHQAVDKSLRDRVFRTYQRLAGLGYQQTPHGEQPHHLSFSPEASQRFFSWQDAQEGRTTGELRPGVQAAMIKLVSYAPRIAAILELTEQAQRDEAGPVGLTWYTPGAFRFRSEPTIGMEALERALTLMDWFENEIRRVYSIIHVNLSGHEKLRNSILELFSTLSRPLSARDVYRQFRSSTVTEVKMLLQELVSRNWLIEEPFPRRPQGGRPSPKYQRGPRLQAILS